MAHSATLSDTGRSAAGRLLPSPSAKSLTHPCSIAGLRRDTIHIGSLERILSLAPEGSPRGAALVCRAVASHQPSVSVPWHILLVRMERGERKQSGITYVTILEFALVRKPRKFLLIEHVLEPVLARLVHEPLLRPGA